MALDKNGRTLPKGVTWLPKKNLYMGRFCFQGEKFTMYDPDLKGIKKKLADKRYEVEHGLSGKCDKISLDSWFKAWMDKYKRLSVRETSFNNYQNLYNCYVQPTLGKRYLTQIRPHDIQQLFGTMFQKGLSVGTITSVKALLSALFETAVQNDLVRKNICAGVKVPVAEVEEPRVLTIDEQAMLLRQMEKEKWQTYGPLVTLMLATGLRLGEALSITWDCVDFENKTLTVDKNLVYVRDTQTGSYVFKIQPPKTAAGKRVIPLVKEAVNALQRQRVVQMRLRLAMGSKWQSIAGFEMLAFTTSHGTPIQESAVRKTLVKVVAEINAEEAARAQEAGREPFVFEHIHPHTLRHSFATRAIERGMEAKTLQRIMGHSKLELTMNLYVHSTAEKKREDMDLLEGVFSA